jgi:hypothetical protein
MKPLRWDAINPLTGKKFTWDDKNLRWGDPSYYLEPGDPGFVPYDTPPAPAQKPKKPFRRKAKLQETKPTLESNTMTTFQYHVAPNPGGGFRTRPVLRDAIGSDAFVALVADSASVTPEQAGAVLDAFVQHVCACAAGCAHGPDIRGKLRFVPTSGGNSETPDGFENPLEMNCDIALSLTVEARDGWRAGLTLESLGEVGKVSPYIGSILSQETGEENRYTPGALVALNGARLRFDKSDTTQGVFFRSGSDPEVRANIYGTVTPTSLSVLVPATLSGPLSVRVAAHINGSVRSFTYMTPITP